VKDLVKGYNSETYGNTVEIVPSVQIPPEKFSDVTDDLTTGVRALEAALGPIRRIVHGDPTAADLEPIVREEIIENAKRAERRNICAELVAEAELQLSKTREGVGLALYMAAWKIAKNGERS
jgi:hypothetical protein